MIPTSPGRLPICTLNLAGSIPTHYSTMESKGADSNNNRNIGRLRTSVLFNLMLYITNPLVISSNTLILLN